jgi:uncharacterized protein YuzE
MITVTETTDYVEIKTDNSYTSYDKRNARVEVIEFEKTIVVKVSHYGNICSIDVWWKDGSQVTSVVYDHDEEVVKSSSINYIKG